MPVEESRLRRGPLVSGINAIAIAMARDKNYPNRTIRISDETWEELKKRRLESKLSWNQFIKELIKHD
jgi:hypothetical protein